MTPSGDISLFFGRFHPVLVHLPIGLIVLLAFLEIMALFRRFRNANQNSGLVLALGVPLSFLTAALGWLLSKEGGYSEQTLKWHMWTGFATAILFLFAGLLYLFQWRKAYRLSLLGTTGVLIVASHYGGSLTHGSDYLVRYAPASLRALITRAPRVSTVALPLKSPQSPSSGPAVPAYTALIKPLLEDKCVTCHGPDKSKGGLRVDSIEAMLKGGDAGPAIVAGKPKESELLRRMLLPLEDEDHMPPDGKPQPAADEIALMEWWVQAGADPVKTPEELNPPAKLAGFLSARLGVLQSPEPQRQAITAPPLERDKILPAAERLEQELGVPIGFISEVEPWLQCSANVAGTNFGDTQLRRLLEVARNVRWLDLGATGVTDDGLAALKEMHNLERLHLEKTAVGDKALGWLTNTPALSYLNLYGTGVTDEGLDVLKGLPRLNHLYLWQTKVSPAGAQAFAESRTDKAQIELWRQEIQQLEAKIRAQQVIVDLGSAAPVPQTTPAPINTLCPVSGKPVVKGITASFDNQAVGFCCEDCKAKFEQDPTPYTNTLKAASVPASGP